MEIHNINSLLNLLCYLIEVTVGQASVCVNVSHKFSFIAKHGMDFNIRMHASHYSLAPTADN